MLTFALENSQMKKRYTEEQIIALLQEVERSGGEIRTVVRKHNISEQTFYRWRAKYGGMEYRTPRSSKVSRRRTQS
jgi:putative transposase